MLLNEPPMKIFCVRHSVKPRPRSLDSRYDVECIAIDPPRRRTKQIMTLPLSCSASVWQFKAFMLTRGVDWVSVRFAACNGLRFSWLQERLFLCREPFRCSIREAITV